MAFFDLHCHPSFKSALLNDDVEQCPNPIDVVDVRVQGIFGPCIEKIAGNSLDSQSSFQQIPGGSLVVASFLAFERAYAFIKDLERLENLGQHILANMRNQTASYFQNLTKRDMAHFLRFQPQSSGGKRYQLINAISEYPANPDPNTVYVVASVEGGHNFYVLPELANQEKPENHHQIIDQLAAWKQQSADQPDRFPRLFYITMTHHGQNVLANHAWAIPIRFASNTVGEGSFNPSQNGLSALGETFLRTALGQEGNQKRILIDIKHLGLASRKRVYELMRNEFSDVPILATHMGIAGTSWNQPPIARINPLTDHPTCLVVTYQPTGGFIRRIPPSQSNSQGFASIAFNPWSINLYNEDILEIMRSKGLIGVSMDRRILGSTPGEDERFSRLDFPPSWADRVPPVVPLNGLLYPNTALPLPFDGIQSKARQDLWAFCQHVIHIVLITELAKNDPTAENRIPSSVDPWDHICLGSDFDGLITALKTSPTAEQLPAFFGDNMKSVLLAMAEHLNKNSPNKNRIQVPTDVIERLRFSNGLNFMKKHFR